MIVITTTQDSNNNVVLRWYDNDDTRLVQSTFASMPQEYTDAKDYHYALVRGILLGTLGLPAIEDHRLLRAQKKAYTYWLYLSEEDTDHVMKGAVTDEMIERLFKTSSA